MRQLFFILAVCCGTLCALLRFFPLSWAAYIHAPEFTFHPDYQGTLWHGSVTNIPNLPRIHFRLSPLKTLGNSAFLQFHAHDTQLEFSGLVGYNRLSQFDLKTQATYLGSIDDRLRNLTGDIHLFIDEMTFNTSQCHSASGRVSTNILTHNAHLWYWQGPDLEGNINCQQNDLVISLHGQDSQTQIQVDLVIKLNGIYRISMTLSSLHPHMNKLLPLYGFHKTPQGYQISEAGQWHYKP